MEKANSLKDVYSVKRSMRMNPNETHGSEDSERDIQTCPTCGMEQRDWKGSKGQGYQQDEETYCCRGCATGAGCTCQETEAEPVPSSRSSKKKK